MLVYLFLSFFLPKIINYASPLKDGYRRLVSGVCVRVCQWIFRLFRFISLRTPISGVAGTYLLSVTPVVKKGLLLNIPIVCSFSFVLNLDLVS